jgi:hypothetical protein
MIVNIGNKDVDLDWIFQLGNWFHIDTSNDDALYLSFKKESYTVEEIRKMIESIFESFPDEVNVEEDGRLRLWWD